MSKHINSFSGKNEKGFTLVEILVAMIILLLIVTACFPLFSLATKTTHENKARIIAAELAKQEIEKTLSMVTPANYYSDSGPLKTAVEIIETENGYIIEKNVEWIDDPQDGLYPADTDPFDFKRLIVKVSYPSLFTGSVKQEMDFDTFIARKGSASPVTGLIVQVNNLLDSIPSTEPVSGALVSVINLETGELDYAVANADGAAFFDVIVPDNKADGKYTMQVEAESSGLIMDPTSDNIIDVLRDQSNNIEISMAEPAQITVKCKTPEDISSIALHGLDYSYNEEVIITGADLSNSVYSKTFSNFWPFGSFEVNANLAVHKTEFVGSSPPEGFNESPPDNEGQINIWQYQTTISPFSWSAKPGDYAADTIFANNNNLKYLLDLSAYYPSDANITISTSYLSPFNDTSQVLSLPDTGSEEDTFVLLKVNTSPAYHAADNAAFWTDVLTINGLNEMAAPYQISLPDNEVVLSEAFALLFRTSPNITELSLNNFYIFSQYRGNITLNTPGDNYILNLTQ